ncbi:MAG: hypothetical protein ACI4BD_04875 [Paludibacteraceae bacterium]
MKKIFLFAALLAATLCATAQQNPMVWHNGKVMYGSPIPTVDSIIFAAEMESSDTLHLILPRTIIKEVHDTTIKEVIKEVIVEVHDTVIKKVYKCPNEPLSGAFSVSETKQVAFSCGNLQYTRSTNTWAFALNQYDLLGTANVANFSLADKIDLFGWSGSTGSAQWGVSDSQSESNYSGDFVDWGQNIGDGTTWRTLTNDEWTYLYETRANAASLMGIARINLDEAGTTYANGLILLPDSWTCPEDITFKSGFSSNNSEQAYAEYQAFTLAQWEKLETAGAVFLPATGYRYGSEIRYVLRGYYWSATPGDSYSAGCLDFDTGAIKLGGSYRKFGFAVRLVQDL